MLRVRVDDVFLAFLPLVRDEEPQLVPDDRTTEGEGGVIGREFGIVQVLVIGDQAIALCVVVDRTVELVTARLTDHPRDQALAALILRRHATGDDLLLLDDLGVEVRAGDAAKDICDVDAINVVDIVR